MNFVWILVFAVSIFSERCQSQDQYVAPNCLKTALTGSLSTYPWFLPFHYDGNYRCGAVIISNEVLLTAAHCVLSLRKDLIRVYLPDGSARKASDVIMYDAYNAYDNNHDVAIIRLNQKIMFNQNIAPVCLPMNKLEPAGKPGRLLAWRFQMTQNHYADALLLVNVTIYSYAECIRMKYKPAAISGYMLCAGNVNRDICQGDTSGPLVVRNEGKWEVVGVSSWNEQCGSPGYPQVYSKLLHYVDWICSQMRIMKVENVECHCAINRAATCPGCGMGYNGRIDEVDANCGVNGSNPNE